MKTLPGTKLQNLLRRRGACIPALVWLGARNRQEAWAECPRSDWLIFAFYALCLWDDLEYIKRWARLRGIYNIAEVHHPKVELFIRTRFELKDDVPVRIPWYKRLWRAL